MQSIRNALYFLTAAFFLVACQPAEEAGAVATSTLRMLATPSPASATVPSIRIPADTPIAPTATPFLHAVQEGETMIGIAVRYGVSLDDLLLANPGVDPGFLTIGQELIIPGPEGSAVGALLPTPTPVALQPEPVACFAVPSGSTWCITQVENTTTLPLEGLSLQMNLLDADGNTLEQIDAYAPLDILFPGERMPFAVLLEEDNTNIAAAYARVLAAVPVQDVESRYAALDISESGLLFNADNRQAEWTGTIRLGTNLPGESGMLRAMLAAYDDEGRIIGYRLYEGDMGAAAGSEVEIALSVFSLGPEIASVELTAEVEPQ